LSEKEPSADTLREDLKSEYGKVFELKQRLDGKASGMIMMSGIIAAVFSGFGTFLLKDILKPNPILFAVSLTAPIIDCIFLVIPESTLGTIALIGSSLGGLGAFWTVRRYKGKLL